MNPFHLLAQDTPPTGLDAWGPTLAQLGIAGAVLYYVGVKLIPRLFDQQDKALVAFAAEMKAQREGCAAEQAAQRAHDEKRTSETHARIDGLASEVRSLSHRAA